MKYIILIILSILLWGCTNNNKEPVLTCFKNHCKINNTISKINSNDLGEIVDMAILDSTLIITEIFSTDIVKLFNVNSGKLIGTIKKGKGPQEILSPGVISKYSDKIFTIFERSRKELLYFSIDSLRKKNSFPLKKDRLDTRCLKAYPLNDSIIIGIGISEHGRFSIFNKKNNTHKFYLDYPNDPGHKNLGDITKGMVFQGELTFNSTKEKFAIACGAAANIDICKLEDEKIEQIFSKTFYLPKYKIIRGNPAFLRESKYAFNSLASTQKYIYTLYSGKSRLDYGDEFYSGKNLLVFDWNGNPIINFQLDRSLYRMTLNEKTSEIYGFDVNPNTGNPEIVIYKLPKH